jgi:hypothetical protein
MHFLPRTKRCYAEAARVRVARFLNDSTLVHLKDTSEIYFETHEV